MPVCRASYGPVFTGSATMRCDRPSKSMTTFTGVFAFDLSSPFGLSSALFALSSDAFVLSSPSSAFFADSSSLSFASGETTPFGSTAR